MELRACAGPCCFYCIVTVGILPLQPLCPGGLDTSIASSFHHLQQHCDELLWKCFRIELCVLGQLVRKYDCCVINMGTFIWTVPAREVSAPVSGLLLFLAMRSFVPLSVCLSLFFFFAS